MDFIREHKGLFITLLSIVVLAVGGFIAFKAIMANMAKPVEMQASPDSFEYTTVSNLKDIFSVSEDELSKSIDSYDSSEGFMVYKRAFYNFINTGKYRVVTTGYSNVDTMGGILVNIRNEKKFDGTNYFMHVKSSAAVEGTFSSMSNNDALHFLYITDNNSQNLATVKLLDVKNPSVVKRKVVMSEKDYVYNYGAIPYTACNFIIRDNTISTSSFSFDEETGLYKVYMELKPVEATEGLIKQMHAVSGTDATYENGSVTYTAYIDSQFTLRRADIKETYQVSTLGMKFSAVSETSDAFSYEGDADFVPLSEDEKYDINDIPVNEDDAAVALTKTISANAITNVKQSGVNADFVLSAAGVEAEGRLQVKFGDVVIIKADTEISGKQLSVYLSLDNEKSGVVLASYGDIKVGLEFERLGDIINRIIPALGIDLGGMNISAIVNGINVNSLIDVFGGIKGTEEENSVYRFEPNLNATGIPLDVPFTMLVKDGAITYFGIDNQNIMGTDVLFSLTPSLLETDITTLTLTEEYVSLNNVVAYLLDGGIDFSLIKSIIENKTVAFELKVAYKDYLLKANAAVDFSDFDDIKVSALIKVDGTEISLYFQKDTVYVKTGNIAVSASIDTLKSYIGIFTDADLSLSDGANKIIDKVLEFVNSSYYSSGILSFKMGKVLVDLADGNVYVNYDGVVTAEVFNLSATASVVKPEADYVDVKGLDDLISNIYEQFSTRYFTANGEITIGKINVSLVDVKIVNLGDTSDPTAAFDNGNLTISGTVILKSNGASHKLYIQYINNTLFAVYNDTLKVKMSRASLDYIVDLVKSEYKTVIQKLNYSEILSSTDTLTKVKDYKFTIGSAISFVNSLTVNDGSIGISLNGTEFGIDNTFSFTAFCNENNNLSLGVTIGDNAGNITLDNTVFDAPTVPSNASAYIDLSEVKGLVKGLVNAIEKESGEYYLSGKATLSILLKNVTVNMDAAIRLVDNDDGGKNIQAVAHISMYDTTVSTFASSYIKCGEGTLIYKDGYFYIRRLDKTYSWFSWRTSSDTKRAMTREYFADNFMSQFGYFMGLTDAILNEFTSSDNEIKFEKVFKNYTVSSSKHTIVLSGSELAGNSTLGNINAVITVDNEQLSKLDISMQIKVSIITMDMNVALTHDVNKTNIDYSDITGLNTSSYGTVLGK